VGIGIRVGETKALKMGSYHFANIIRLNVCAKLSKITFSSANKL
jgi:hypothetical protein